MHSPYRCLWSSICLFFVLSVLLLCSGHHGSGSNCSCTNPFFIFMEANRRTFRKSIRLHTFMTHGCRFMFHVFSLVLSAAGVYKGRCFSCLFLYAVVCYVGHLVSLYATRVVCFNPLVSSRVTCNL